MEHGAAHGPSLHHPTWFRFLYVYDILPDWLPEMVPVTWFVIIVLSAMAIIGRRSLRLRNPGRFQMFLEFVVTSLDNFIRGIVGNDLAKLLTPIVGTAFIFIFSLSLIGLVPGFVAPTADTNTTVAFALLAFILVQVLAISRVGIKNYVMHFVGEPVWLAPLMVPLHIIGEIARPISLAIRLFGNIFGEETVVGVFVLIALSVLGIFYWVPIQFPMMLFAMFGGFIQSLVFSMLVCIYIAVAIGGHEEHH